MHVIVAIFLVAHALIHASFVGPRPAETDDAPAWPFRLDRSWLLGRLRIGAPASRAIGLVLLAVVLAGFIVAAVAAVGLAPAWLFAPGVVLGSLASIAMLVLFYHPWLTLGLLIDLGLLWAVLIVGWKP